MYVSTDVNTRTRGNEKLIFWNSVLVPDAELELTPTNLRAMWILVWKRMKYFWNICSHRATSQKTNTCSKPTIETVEKGVKYVQSYH